MVHKTERVECCFVVFGIIPKAVLLSVVFMHYQLLCSAEFFLRKMTRSILSILKVFKTFLQNILTCLKWHSERLYCTNFCQAMYKCSSLTFKMVNHSLATLRKIRQKYTIQLHHLSCGSCTVSLLENQTSGNPAWSAICTAHRMTFFDEIDLRCE